jgi:hypothetical protein
MIGIKMNPHPPPPVPGKTEFERFDNAVRHIFSVSKEEIERREQLEKRKRDRKKPQPKKP